MAADTYPSILVTSPNNQNLYESSSISPLMAISSEAVDGSLQSSHTETLNGKSLVVSPSSLPIDTVDGESMDHSPLNLDGSDCVQTLDGSLASSHTEAPGDCFSFSESSNPNGSFSIVSTASGNQVPSSLNPVEFRDYDSVVSSNGSGFSPSSPLESLDDPITVDLRPRETPHDDGDDDYVDNDCNDHKSLMQIEFKKSPSSSSGLGLLDEEVEEDMHDSELNNENHNPYICICNEFHPFRRERGRCGPSCRFPIYSRWKSPWDPSREGPWIDSWNRENREDNEYMPLGLLRPVQENVATGVGAGLSNLGNTCFINAIMQCFTHTVPLVKALQSCNHSRPCQRGIEGFCVVCALHDHIKYSLASSGKIIAPLEVVDNLNYISSCFRRYQQEDAHEFLQCLLDKLERCSLNSNLNGETSSSQDDNIVERVFGGRLVSKLQCCNCGHCSDKYESLIDLSLEIEDVGTLQSALESFTKVEKIEDPDTKFTCDTCKEEVSREKQLILDRAPSVATFHLKRFKTDGSSIEKICKHVDFPLELDLKPYSNGSQESNDNQVDLKYQLYAIVVHNGFLPTSGHYFSYIRSAPNTWHKLDDSMVVKVDEELVLSQAAYILFYAREGTPWFSSLIELQDCLDPSISNTSPKSVLDSMETERTEHPHLVTTRGDVERTSAHFTTTSVVEEAQINETGNDVEEISAQISNRSVQSRPKLCCNESRNDISMNDVSVSLGTRDCHDGILHSETLGSLPSVDENDSGQSANIIGRNDLHPPTPPRSSIPDVNFGGLPEARHQIRGVHLKVENSRRDHLKVKNSLRDHLDDLVNCKKSKKATRDQRMEALRYINRNVPNTRGMKLLAAMLPQNDKKRRIRSSPCKRTSPPSSRYKHNQHLAVLR